MFNVGNKYIVILQRIGTYTEIIWRGKIKGEKKMFNSKYFKLGRQVASQKVSIELMENKQFATEIFHAMKRYCNKDWGILSDGDKEMNEQALQDEDRLMGAYMTCKGKIWIITEWDRSSTIILFPDEY